MKKKGSNNQLSASGYPIKVKMIPSQCSRQEIWLIFYRHKAGHAENHAKAVIIGVAELQRRLNAQPQQVFLTKSESSRRRSEIQKPTMGTYG